jgi:predicted nucleic acid-binding protein
VIVIDASAALAALYNNGPARQTLGHEQLHAPHLVDSEVASGLRRRVAAGQVKEADGHAALNVWRRLAVTRYATHSLLDRIWELRHNLSSYDAGYVALAEALDCPLVTADARLAGAPGTRCTITIVPR